MRTSSWARTRPSGRALRAEAGYQEEFDDNRRTGVGAVRLAVPAVGLGGERFQRGERHLRVIERRSNHGPPGLLGGPVLTSYPARRPRLSVQEPERSGETRPPRYGSGRWGAISGQQPTPYVELAKHHKRHTLDLTARVAGLRGRCASPKGGRPASQSERRWTILPMQGCASRVSVFCGCGPRQPPEASSSSCIARSIGMVAKLARLKEEAYHENTFFPIHILSPPSLSWHR